LGENLQEVLIDQRCFFTLITASLEVYNRETTGLIVGKIRERKLNGRKKKYIVLEAAYPFQTAKRKPTWCDIGNFEAFERARASMHSLNFSMVGEFHSHPNRQVRLSEADVRYIRERVKEMYQNGNSMLNHHWLELVISVKKRHYKRAQKTGWSWRKKNKKLECIVRFTPYLGYKIQLGGFWVNIHNNDNRRHQAKLRFTNFINSQNN
jgi:proteasome lid subunit RPN8/RPN11